MWVTSRQFTRRIVTIANSKSFDESVYNYARDFPYIWEELTVLVAYKDDRHRAETILLHAARSHALLQHHLSRDAIDHMRRRYLVNVEDLDPRVFYRLTDNWLELTVRFLAHAHGVREVKDAMSREILAVFDQPTISIASATFEVVGVPPLQIQGAGSCSHNDNRNSTSVSSSEERRGEP